MSKFRRTARFNFDPPPRDSDELPHYLSDVFSTLGAMVNSQTRNFAPMKVEPNKPVDGDMAFADGDDVNGWDPGSGRGIYYYDNGWVKL
jgi:hypothetical protein